MLDKLPVKVVDAFTSTPFSGNPAGVCILDVPLTDATMQMVAREMNHAETAFYLKTYDGKHSLRWFTPAKEVDLCGHATLATVHVLAEQGLLDENGITFSTRSGELHCTVTGGMIELDFPTIPLEVATQPEGLFAALGVEGVFHGTTSTMHSCLIEVADEESVRNLEPDMAALRRLEPETFIVTTKGSGEYDFISRMFAPKLGIDEDPVTGMAHCIMSRFWAGKLGKKEFTAYQASRRGGTVSVTYSGERTQLRGTAVTVLEGILHI